MTSNFNSISGNREVGDQSPSNHSIVTDSLDIPSVKLSDGYDSHIANGVANSNLSNKNNPSTSNDPLVNSVTSVRRPLSLDLSDDDFRLVSYKKAHKPNNGLNHDIGQNGLGLNVSASSPSGLNRTTTTSPTLVLNSQSSNGVSAFVNSTKKIAVTDESTRYALTRYPFAPFVLHFKTGKVTINQVKKDIIAHCKQIHKMDIQLLNCRSTNVGLRNDEYNILVYVKDVISFSLLLENENWPNLLGNQSYILQTVPSIPPQLCLLIKNVDLNIDLDEFCKTIQDKYPQVKNIIRMKNKFQNDIKMIKLELTCSITRDKLLNEKRILVNHVSYDIVEYLSPTNVLICSKCMALGHFKKQCTQTKETCRTCGELYGDIKEHKCSKIEKCIHCNENHKSSSLKCSVVKNYRAELTRKLLQLNNPVPVAAVISSTLQNHVFNPSNFRPPQVSQSSHITPMMNKLDDLIKVISEVKNQLINVEAKQNKLEQFILQTERNDEFMKQNLSDLSSKHDELKKDVVQHSLFIDRNENLFIKLIIPMFQDLFTFISSINVNKDGKSLDADLKYKLERYLVQLKNAKQGKHFSN